MAAAGAGAGAGAGAPFAPEPPAPAPPSTGGDVSMQVCAFVGRGCCARGCTSHSAVPLCISTWEVITLCSLLRMCPEQDRFLPVANIARIVKRALPPQAKIAKDAKDTIQESVSEFISFVTSEASDKCKQEKRKTVNGDDILWAMTTLGFEDYLEPLKLYLTRFREVCYGGVSVALPGVLLLRDEEAAC